MNFLFIIYYYHHCHKFISSLLLLLLLFFIDPIITKGTTTTTTTKVSSSSSTSSSSSSSSNLSPTSFFSSLFNRSHLYKLITSIEHNPDHKLVKILPEIDYIIFDNNNSNNETNQQQLFREDVQFCYDDTVDRGNNTVNLFQLSIGDIVYKFLVSNRFFYK